MSKRTINIGVIGCGYWGPNHIRVFSHLNESHVLMVADPDQARLQAISKTFPDVQTTVDHKEILNNSDIDAVCIAAPTEAHYSLTQQALECGKHVLCEKPLAMTPGQCEELKNLAEQVKKVLMVGHIFVFNAGITWLKKYIQSGKLGKIYYAYSTRTNLGPFRYDVNALWDLAPHDISIFNYLFEGFPTSASGRGQKCLGETLEDLAFATLSYSDNIIANVHVSWLDPKKVRQITVVGDKQMVVWDDLDQAGPIKLYDSHVEKTATFYETYGEFQLLSKEGSMTMPKIDNTEPLQVQGTYFLECIENNGTPDLADAQKARDVVKALCAIQTSIEQNGSSINIS